MKKMEITYFDFKNENEKLFLAFGLGFGYATKAFEGFTSNYAFGDILLVYLTRSLDFEVKVISSPSLISVIAEVDAKDYISAAKAVLDVLLNRDYDENLFKEAKRDFIEFFENKYKEESVRANFKIMEQAHFNKFFKLKGYIDDIQNISFEDFVECAEHLVVPSNIKMLVGGLGDDTHQELYSQIESIISSDQEVAQKYDIMNPMFRSDSHIVELSRNSYFVGCLSFSYLVDLDNTTKFIMISLASAKLGVATYKIFVDDFDCSIVLEGDPNINYKELYKNKLTEEEFENIKSNLVLYYAKMAKEFPREFSFFYFQLKFSEISFEEMFNILGQLPYEDYCRAFDENDVIIHYNQLVLVKEQKM